MCTCQCDCGKVVEVRRDSLISGNTTSCGCSRHEDLTGQRFGKLTALSYEGYKSRAALWRCRCDYGKEIITLASRLKSGNTTSCGCAVDITKTLQDMVEGTRLGSISPSRSKDTRTIWDYTIRLMRLRKRGEMRKKSISHHLWKNTRKAPAPLKRNRSLFFALPIKKRFPPKERSP